MTRTLAKLVWWQWLIVFVWSGWNWLRVGGNVLSLVLILAVTYAVVTVIAMWNRGELGSGPGSESYQ